MELSEVGVELTHSLNVLVVLDEFHDACVHLLVGRVCHLEVIKVKSLDLLGKLELWLAVQFTCLSTITSWSS